MLEDKIRATDYEATSEAIEEQVAHESYLQWIRENDQRAKGQVNISVSVALCIQRPDPLIEVV